MKQIAISLICIFMANNVANAQTNDFDKDVKSIDALMKASYEVVSGEKGVKRQWQRDHYLHHPKAVYSYFDKQIGKQVTVPLIEFHKETDDMIFETAFYETEVNREVRLFGNIAHVWSTYETKLAQNESVERRGINSVQLIFENNRWYIISWTFCGESETNKIPATFDKN